MVLWKAQQKPETDNMRSLRLTPQAACDELNQSCCSLVAGQVTLKWKHAYFYHVQRQMAIANKPWSDFGYGLHLEFLLNRDRNFWQQKITLSKSQTFISSICYIPEISDLVYPTRQKMWILLSINVFCSMYSIISRCYLHCTKYFCNKSRLY